MHAEAGLIDLLSVLRGRPPDAYTESLSHADLYAGVHLALSIVAALHQRSRTGRGQRVDVSMAKVLLHVNEFAAQQLTIPPGEARPPAPPAADAAWLATGDGGLVMLLPPRGRSFFLALCEAMGRDDLRDDPRFADKVSRRKNRRALYGIVQEWILACDDLDEVERRLDAVDVAVGRVRSVHELGATPWAKECGAVAEVSDGGGGVLRLPNVPWEFTDAEARVRGEPAYRGEHNRDVLAGLGLSSADIDALESSGVLSSRPPRGAVAAGFRS